VRIRPLRTQQRAKSQCQKPGFGGGFGRPRRQLILAMTDEQHNQRLLNRQDPATVQAVVASFVDNPISIGYL
jgi:hypothetical protein